MAIDDPVGVCNLALARIGNKNLISSLTEQSAEAHLCNMLYEISLDEMLGAHPWSFATAFVDLALANTDPPSTWGYRYTYPENCVFLRSLVTPSNRYPDTPIQFVVAYDPVNENRSVLADDAAPVACFTYKVRTVPSFSTGFIHSLSWLLASELSISIARDKQLRQSTWQIYRDAIEQAKAGDRMEQFRDPDRLPAMLRARA